MLRRLPDTHGSKQRSRILRGLHFDALFLQSVSLQSRQLEMLHLLLELFIQRGTEDLTEGRPFAKQRRELKRLCRGDSDRSYS